MTVQKKMKQVFGIAFQSNCEVFSKGNLNGIIDCRGMDCSRCPLHDRCNRKGIREWLESEYDENEAKTLEEEYQRGVEDGRKQVYEELSKIFMR